MTDPIAKEVIRAEMPSARFVNETEVDSLSVVSPNFSVTPSSEAMLKKWGSRSFLRSSADGSDAAELSPESDADVAVEVVEVGDQSLPGSLRRRTVLVDKKKRKIISTTG